MKGFDWKDLIVKHAQRTDPLRVERSKAVSIDQ